ncbi:general odorant-binding protein 56h-like [Neocloeon triangulifer]|uniref:general odorant-binding protein 56h-like n=1 Tax=Neocloeon triangulifer TaxID=2078957 RepID=UPI00286F6250|nr:general odorant-binding protein 56h-like [Neocloeon triangulifer]
MTKNIKYHLNFVFEMHSFSAFEVNKMRFVAAPVLLLLLVCFANADVNEWRRKMAGYQDACVKELNLAEGQFKTFEETKPFTTLEEFSVNDRCLMKCVMEKEVGQTADDFDKFFEKRIQLLDRFGSKKSPEIRKTLKDSLEACKDQRGENACDTIVKFHLCKKANLDKAGMRFH